MKRNEQLKEFLKLSKDDLQRSLREKQENLRVFRFDLAAGKVKDIRQIRVSRRNIARVLTLIKK